MNIQTTQFRIGSHEHRLGFTLIELLIVVAIIAILAAIAVPNFLEAQTRSKVARAKSDIRTIATALEVYATDYRMYPPVPVYPGEGAGFPGTNCPFALRMKGLTTPVTYIAGIPNDVFPPIYGGPTRNAQLPIWHSYIYSRADMYPGSTDKGAYVLNSVGPDLRLHSWSYYTVSQMIYWESVVSADPYLPARYDPTNGTISNGDIYRWGPGGTTIN